MAFPLFVLAMGIVAALGNTVGNIVLATAIINLPFYIRVARAEANVRRSAGFVEAARLSGNSDCAHPGRAPVPQHPAAGDGAGEPEHGLGDPERRGPVASSAWACARRRRSGASWSPKARSSSSRGEWWVSFFPGAVLMLAVFTFNLLGDALRDIFDPRRRT